MSLAVSEAVSSGQYASKSEFFRYLLRMWFENKLASDLGKSRLEFQSGKAKHLKSLKDLR